MPAIAPATDAGDECEDTLRHPMFCFSIVLATRDSFFCVVCTAYIALLFAYRQFVRHVINLHSSKVLPKWEIFDAQAQSRINFDISASSNDPSTRQESQASHGQPAK